MRWTLLALGLLGLLFSASCASLPATPPAFHLQLSGPITLALPTSAPYIAKLGPEAQCLTAIAWILDGHILRQSQVSCTEAVWSTTLSLTCGTHQVAFAGWSPATEHWSQWTLGVTVCKP